MRLLYCCDFVDHQTSATLGPGFLLTKFRENIQPGSSTTAAAANGKVLETDFSWYVPTYPPNVTVKSFLTTML